MTRDSGNSYALLLVLNGETRRERQFPRVLG